MLKGQRHAKWLVAPLKGRAGQTVANGPGFSDFPVTAIMANPLAMATRKDQEQAHWCEEKPIANPDAGPEPLELGQPDTNEDSTCWRGCRDSDCTDRYPHEDCDDFEDEREVNERVDKK